MIDYILVYKRFRTSVLDTCVYRVYRSTLHESDHELVISSLRFKIKAKRRQTRASRYETINVPSSCKASYQSVLSETLNISDRSSLVKSLWKNLKQSSIHKAFEVLPPSQQHSDQARNSWWSKRAEEAECWALVAEQQGRGGSLIKDLQLLQKKFCKPASSTLLQSDEDKLNRWAEHFEEVGNCQVDVDVVPLEDLPIASLLGAS